MSPGAVCASRFSGVDLAGGVIPAAEAVPVAEATGIADGVAVAETVSAPELAAEAGELLVVGFADLGDFSGVVAGIELALPGPKVCALFRGAVCASPFSGVDSLGGVTPEAAPVAGGVAVAEALGLGDGIAIA